jgi:hypothetical protein
MFTLSHPFTGEPVAVATSWAELTLAQAQYLLDNSEHYTADTFGIIGAMCTPRLTRDAVQNIDEKHTDELLAALAFAGEPVPHFTKVPRVVRLRNFDDVEVEVVIPTELKLASFGQASDLGASIVGLAENIPALRLRALAIYLMPQLVGSTLPARYDTDLLGKTELHVGALRFDEALPITDFFLPILRRPFTPTAKTYSSESSLARSNGPASTSSVRAGIATLLPTRLRKVIRSSYLKFSANLGKK